MNEIAKVEEKYDLTKMLRAIKRAEISELEEEKIRNRIMLSRQKRLERKGMRILWVFQKLIGIIMALCAIVAPEYAIVLVPIALVFLINKNILNVKVRTVDIDEKIVEVTR